MNKAEIAKRATYVATDFASLWTLNTLVEKMTTPKMKTAAKVGIMVGAVVANALVGEVVQKTIDSQFDVIANKIRMFKKK